MASRARGSGAARIPAGTKLARSVPMGVGLRPPSGSGNRKQSPQPESISKPVSGRTAGQSRSSKAVTPAAEPLNGEIEVGDRVVVNGLAGKLAFLGATQFARGTWAGIILDTQAGKNNGIVNGVQYFECGTNRGLFSKPEKLTVVPRSNSSTENKPKSHGTPHSPSLAQHTPTSRSFTVGDRVSLDGVKEGVIGFMGETQFAKGIWVGVILETPDGKNNGSVNGVQYFECGPNRGLFAKPEKLTIVSRGTPGASTKSSSRPPPSSSSVQHTPSPGHFEVGDRVLVDGLKEGMVGFLGETQFARGLWAGVILGVPEGKNDGSVNGMRYFTCEPNHGIFARPIKLELISRAQDETPGTSHTPVQNQGAGGGMQSGQLTPTNLKVLQEKLKVGDHVLVGGVKEGILRYLGPTEFARGIWVGVELPEPLGKNDGAISGKRSVRLS